MYVMPSQQTEARPNGDGGGRRLVGPGFAAVIGVGLLTSVYRFDGTSMVQYIFNMSGQAVLLTCVVAYLVAAVLTGALGFVFGARFPTAVTLSAIVVMLIGTALTALSPNAAVLLVGRVVGGLGAGAVIGVVAALLRRLGDRRGTAVAAALGILTALIAPGVGQLISEVTGFRVVYLVAVPFLLIALILTAVSGSSAKRPTQPILNGMPYPPQGPAQYPNPYGTQYPPQMPNQVSQGAQYPSQMPGQYSDQVPRGAQYPSQMPGQYPDQAPQSTQHPSQYPAPQDMQFPSQATVQYPSPAPNDTQGPPQPPPH
ncbi:MFS transporter [Nocardia macrotermitis]|nr:MFS transporter [Nocardia macrotermitis]